MFFAYICKLIFPAFLFQTKPNTKIYVYDMPLEYTWDRIPQPHKLAVVEKLRDATVGLYEGEYIVHLALLRSCYLTSDPNVADFFFIPVWSGGKSWGNWRAEGIHLRALDHIRNLGFWSRRNGTDHIFVSARDCGTCGNFQPEGLRKCEGFPSCAEFPQELDNAIWLTHWGGLTGYTGAPCRRGFREGHDIVIPNGQHHKLVVKASPHWRPVPEEEQGTRDVPQAATATQCGASHNGSPREAKVFFAGKSHFGGYPAYSLGARQEVWRHYK
ncbi:hypothetical protein CYMTET_22816 [Cymbomonas tetramitiformis]|uniref:Exostosin GT47 domain-containing protein n=1 Tax=Cymbomonas tetramitiformis TaxID=36881 RepID=A0AAE0FZ64_9CHLO|nr:hypothetical protein CYMTET_22816 [Cymbomonas tetramitiformis]